jgi:hypothetical protein
MYRIIRFNFYGDGQVLLDIIFLLFVFSPLLPQIIFLLFVFSSPSPNHLSFPFICFLFSPFPNYLPFICFLSQTKKQIGTFKNIIVSVPSTNPDNSCRYDA